jgi:hypothetical protein
MQHNSFILTMNSTQTYNRQISGQAYHLIKFNRVYEVNKMLGSYGDKTSHDHQKVISKQGPTANNH